MSNAVDFRELLSMPTDNFEAPSALPTGHYRGRVGRHEFGKSAKKGTPYVRFYYSVSEALEDVEDPTGILEKIDITQKELREDFYLTPDALFRLTKRLNNILGMQSGRTFDERIPETRDVDVIIGVERRVDEKDETQIYNDIGSVVAVD